MQPRRQAKNVFIQLIKDRMKELGLEKQIQLAKAAKVSPGIISRLLSGESNKLTLEYTYRILKALRLLQTEDEALKYATKILQEYRKLKAEHDMLLGRLEELLKPTAAPFDRERRACVIELKKYLRRNHRRNQKNQ